MRLPLDWPGLAGKVADTFNEVVEPQRTYGPRTRTPGAGSLAGEGSCRNALCLGDVTGSWADAIDSVNDLISDLVHPTSETARVIGAVAQGNLSQTMALEIDDRPLQGEFLGTARTINKISISSAPSPPDR